MKFLQSKTTLEVQQEFARLSRLKPTVTSLSHVIRKGSTVALRGFEYCFFDQKDNGPDGWRQCQSSSIAMCLRYLKVKGISDDVDYLRIAMKYGISEAQETHIAALKAMGVKASFSRTRTIQQFKDQIDKGRPIAVGNYHHGPVTAPSGGGHYNVIYGYTDKAWMIMDPYGSQDLVGGSWSARGHGSGRAQLYSFANYNRRVFVPSDGHGWAWFFE